MAVSAAVLALGLFGLFGCAGNGDGASGATDGGASASTSPSGEVSVYSREDGSGTRGAFIELFGIEEKVPTADKVDLTTPTAAITNATSVMMTSVAGDANAIRHYISLGSLNNTVKALSIDGAEATAENVKSGTYKMAVRQYRDEGRRVRCGPGLHRLHHEFRRSEGGRGERLHLRCRQRGLL